MFAKQKQQANENYAYPHSDWGVYSSKSYATERYSLQVPIMKLDEMAKNEANAIRELAQVKAELAELKTRFLLAES